MSDGQITVNGHAFGGAGSPLQIGPDTELGAVEVELPGTALPGQHGELSGRGVLGTATWTLNLWTNHEGQMGPELARAALDEWRALARVWRESTLRPSGASSTLRLAHSGREVLVYGRAGRISSPRPVDPETQQGVVLGSAQFRLTDPVVYDAQTRSLELTLTSRGGGGATWPLTWPVTWGASGMARQGVVRVEGDADVPFRVTIHGPVAGAASGFALSGPGWWIDLDESLPAGGRIVVDTRAMTATRDGRSAAGGLTRRSRLSARLAPGDSEITFTADDPTATCRAVVAWQDGWWSL